MVPRSNPSLGITLFFLGKKGGTANIFVPSGEGVLFLYIL
ncbi:hypothetical protein HMPREF3182_00433 [Megasphaera hutchinsoni]|uniref:Uncharacterized protein n=1 Tax=Megasphaera hutchinsoni TaxID=1588748 RepID=A0A134CJX8_9FIRM|nr:hypothetical protein HMPREF3182_00433 [Megasphaera hutchinsoni]